ncbi:MAG: PQQ-binding-like beta-propeller repeat protein, partial [Chloroflexota bacterium]
REEGETIGPLVGRPVIADGTVYVSSSDGRVYALDVRFGDEVWVSDKLSEKLWAAPVISGSHLYVTTFDGRIHGLEAETGKLLRWTFEAESGFVSSPALHQDVLLAGSAGRRLYAVRLGEEEAIWELEGGDWFWATPLVSQGRVYASCLDGKLYALDAETGEPLWSEPFDAGERLATSPVLVEGSLVIATEPGDVFIVDAQTGRGKLVTGGKEDRDYTVGGKVLASLGASGDNAYVLTQEDRLYAVDVRQETISWELSLELE